MSKSWYVISVFTGYEAKIERTLNQYLANGEISSEVLTDVKLPVEEVTDVKDGKKRVHKELILPGYLMLEMDLPQLGWKTVCSQIRRIQGVAGFVGTKPSEKPRPISTEEAKSILTKSGDIKGEKPRVKQNFEKGDKVKIIEGSFATFTGEVAEVSIEKGKLKVNVEVFGRPTPVELDFLEVEKI